MRSRDVLLALLIIGCGLFITGTHRGTFVHEPWYREAVRAWRDCVDQAWADGANWREVERSSQSVPAGDAEQVTVDNLSGMTSATSGPAGEVRIDVVRYGRGATQQEAAANAELARLEVKRFGREIAVIVTGPPGFEWNARLELIVAIPEGMSVRTDGGGGHDWQWLEEARG